MNQSKAKRLIPKLRYNLHDRRKLKNPESELGRHNKIRKTVTALFKYERIEMNYHRADESRGYAERLISDAIRYGDCHQPTMEMASYWLLEKQLVHKLFKVLVPRYQNYGLSYTKLWKAPNIYPGHGRPKCVIELRNNIFPSLAEDKSFNKNLIHNVLLDAARKAFNAKRTGEAVMSPKAAVGETVEENVNAAAVGETVDENVNAAAVGETVEENVNAAAVGETVEENVNAAAVGETVEENVNAAAVGQTVEENVVNAAAAATADSNTKHGEMSMTGKESEEMVGTDSVSGSDVDKENSGAVSSVENGINELEITEKQKESPNEEEKK